MNVQRLEKLEDVLQNLGPDQRIKDYELTRLTAPGDNYGSLMLKLQVTVQNEKTKLEENWDLVAKLLPPSEMLQELFNCQVTYKNEVAFYRDIVPTLEEFQREQGVREVVSPFPKYYGARLSLDPNSEKVDQDAVLLLENLKISGFTTVKRKLGFDLDAARLLLRDLAHFHAISLALKLKEPDVFEQKIKPHLADFFFPDGHLENTVEDVVKILKQHEECVPYLERVKQLIRQKSVKIVREPFATISHNDFWVNNIMLKFENDKPVASRMVDFQVIEYKSPCRDLIFFLFSSVQLKVLEESLDDLLDIYYTYFIEKLEELKCDATPFSRQVFDLELALAAKEAEYFHTVYMLFVVHADETQVKELSNISADDFKETKDLGIEFRGKLKFVTTEFIKRGWLNCFTTVDRKLGFDLNAARLLLRDLAHFHAISLGLKLKKSDVFEKKIKPYLADFFFTDENLDVTVEHVVEILKDFEECVPYLERITELIRQKCVKIVREPFATISHNDFWVNNIMLKFDNGKPVASKILDFQVVEYKSPCRDLIFFLFTSVQLKVLEENLDALLNYYYKNFIEKLEELKCDAAPFSRQVFDLELSLAAKESEYFHTVIMLYVVCADETQVKELSNLSTDDLKETKELGIHFKEKLKFVTTEFIKRGWL